MQHEPQSGILGRHQLRPISHAEKSNIPGYSGCMALAVYISSSFVAWLRVSPKRVNTLLTWTSGETSMEYLSLTGTLKRRTSMLVAIVAIFGPTPSNSKNRKTIRALLGRPSQIREATPPYKC